MRPPPRPPSERCGGSNSCSTGQPCLRLPLYDPLESIDAKPASSCPRHQFAQIDQPRRQHHGDDDQDDREDAAAAGIFAIVLVIISMVLSSRLINLRKLVARA